MTMNELASVPSGIRVETKPIALRVPSPRKRSASAP